MLKAIVFVCCVLLLLVEGDPIHWLNVVGAIGTLALLPEMME